MATHDTSDGKQQSAPRAVGSDRLGAVLATGRIEFAKPKQKRSNADLIAPNQYHKCET